MQFFVYQSVSQLLLGPLNFRDTLQTVTSFLFKIGVK